ncbi:hypothetical protein [Pandoraea sp. NPDC087047]|uniref:hypothetical protein n=1 Tax=Pandoraea sp. NPDC087047 TaxID=3364390 RepID=UPI00381254D8
MKNHTPPSRLPADMKLITSKIIGCILAFDRVAFSVDDLELPPGLASEVAEHCESIRVIQVQNPYHRTWGMKVELHQPTPVALSILNKKLGPRNITRVSSVEVAIDWLTANKKDAFTVGAYVLEHLRIPHARHRARFVKATFYSDRRATRPKSRTNKVAVLYPDKPSKLLARKSAKRCCHLEFRYQNRGACASIGLNTIGDCASFDHEAFWRHALALYTFRHMHELGAVVGSKQHISDAALRKQAKQFLAQHSAPQFYSDTFVLHDCLHASPNIKTLLKNLDNRHFLKKITLT